MAKETAASLEAIWDSVTTGELSLEMHGFKCKLKGSLSANTPEELVKLASKQTSTTKVQAPSVEMGRDLNTRQIKIMPPKILAAFVQAGVNRSRE